MGAGRFGAVIFAAVAVGLCGGALAQTDAPSDTEKVTEPQAAPGQQNTPGDAVSAMVGAWEFSNADHDKICHFNFRSDAAAGGYKLDIDKNCPNLFPSTKDIVAWAVDDYGDLRLLDAGGNAVVELSEVEGGMYDGFTPQEGRYILQTAAAAPMRSADDMVGDWAVSRGAGKPICTLTLANSPAGDGLGAQGQARLRSLRHPLCAERPGAWTRAHWSCCWPAARPGSSRRTTPIPGNACRKSADPILLVRQ